MYEIRVLTVPMDQPARVSLPEKPGQTSTGSDKSDAEERGSTPTSQYLSTPSLNSEDLANTRLDFDKGQGGYRLRGIHGRHGEINAKQ